MSVISGKRRNGGAGGERDDGLGIFLVPDARGESERFSLIKFRAREEVEDRQSAEHERKHFGDF